MAFRIGIDVGNYDTKTQNTTTPSGYIMQRVEPGFSEEWLLYNDVYYIPSEERFAFSMDKTENGHALILSLFGIAKEIIHHVTSTYQFKNYEENKKYYNNNGDGKLQELVSRINKINLGIGLPPGHFDSLQKKTKEYYMDKFKDEVKFTYNGIRFSVKLNEIKVLPQDFMAVWKNPNSMIVKEFDKYYIVGIGGYTVDIVLVKKGRVDPQSCRSLPLGTTVMYDNIRKEALKEGVDISADAIERALQGKKQILKEEVVTMIQDKAKFHTENIIDSCITSGVKFSEAPVVYTGGGCLLLKKYLEENRNVIKYEFIENVNANAYFYSKAFKED